MSHLAEYADGQDETILRYIDNCSPSIPYEGPESVSFEIRSREELIAALKFGHRAIERARSDFISAVLEARSSDAKFLALGFRFQRRLQSQLLRIAEERHGVDWAERMFGKVSR